MHTVNHTSAQELLSLKGKTQHEMIEGRSNEVFFQSIDWGKESDYSRPSSGRKQLNIEKGVLENLKLGSRFKVVRSSMFSTNPIFDQKETQAMSQKVDDRMSEHSSLTRGSH